MNLFADDPHLDFRPLGTIKGRVAIRGILEYDLALNTHLDLQNCEVNGREVRCHVVESNDWLKMAGIQSITYDENRFVFVEDGRIDSVIARLSAESEQMIGKAMAEFHQWAIVNQPEEYARLFSEDGAFIYNRENVENVLVLLKNWRGKH